MAIFGLLGYGLFRYRDRHAAGLHRPGRMAAAAAGTQALGLLLILRAFSSGSVALTGTEAVSNGVPAFKPPEPRHAQTVLILMGACFATIFLGMSFLAGQLGILPDPTEQETVISQLTRDAGRRRALSLPGPARHRAAAGTGRQHRLRRLSAAC